MPVSSGSGIWVNNRRCKELIDCEWKNAVNAVGSCQISDFAPPSYVELSTIVEESSTFFDDALFDTIDKLRPEERRLIDGSWGDIHQTDISIVSEIQHSAAPADSGMGWELNRGRSARMISLDRSCCVNEQLLPMDTDFEAPVINVSSASADNGTNGLSETEIKNMQLSEFEQFLEDLTQQELKRATLPMKLFRGSLGFLCIGGMGFVLLVCGAIVLLLGIGHREYVSQYKSGDSKVIFNIDKELQPPLYVYAKITDFLGNYRKYMISRPEQVFGGYTCGEFERVSQAYDIRDPISIPRIVNLNASDSSPLFPCGIVSFAMYNDEIQFLFSPDDNMRYISGVLHAREKLVLFTVDTSHLKNLWIAPDSPQYQSWAPMQFTTTFKLGLGRIESINDKESASIKAGTFEVLISKNLWPAEAWKATKAIVIEKMAPLGSEQKLVGIIIISCGCVLIAVGGGLYLLVRLGVLKECKYEYDNEKEGSNSDGFCPVGDPPSSRIVHRG